MRFSIFISLVLTCIGFVSCSDDEPKQNPTKANRTILVYMIANNSLGNAPDPYHQYDDKDLDEMLTALSQNSINNGRLIVYHVPPAKEGAPTLKEVTPNGIVSLKTYKSSTLSTDPTQLEQVISDTYNLAPALDYGLVLWSHSSAWLEYPTARSAYKGNINPLAFGEEITNNGTFYMKITSLAQVLNKHNFSFIYFDSCHMASIEVVYELKDAAKYIIASATELPADGMPYDQNIPLFFKETPQLTQACQNTFNFYNSLTGADKTCSISLIETSHLEELASIAREIFESRTALPSNFSPQQFVYGTNCYSFDLEQYLSALSPNEKATQNLKDALHKVVIYKDATPYIWGQIKMNYHCGLGCNILKQESDATKRGYNNHLWWLDVVKYQFQ